MKKYIFALLILSFLIPTPVYSQTLSNQQSTEKSKQRQEYESLLAEWKPMVAQLAKLRYKYFDVKRKPGEGEIMQVEQTPERKALKVEFDALYEKAERTYNQLIQSAVLAYSKSPENNRDIEGFLMYTLQYFMQRDMYEDAAKMSEILLAQNVSNPYVIRAAAESALYTCNFETAKRFIEKIKEQGILTDYQFDQSDFRYVDVFQRFWEREEKMRRQEEEKEALPRVILYTTKGEIEIILYEDQAPNTVKNFIFLCEKGFYDNLDFHRVISGFMAQGGGTEQLRQVDNLTLQPLVRGNGTPGYTILDEVPQFNFEKKDFPEDARFHWRGTVSMALTDQPNTGGSQFFIMYKPNLPLNGRHTVFGRVVRGMDVVCRFQRRDPGKSISLATLPMPDKILRVKVSNKRNHDYVPQIMPDKGTVKPYPNMPVLEKDRKKDPDQFDVMDYLKKHGPWTDPS